MKLTKSVMALAVAGAMASAAQAQNLVQNSSFESVTMVGAFGATSTTPQTNFTDAYRMRTNAAPAQGVTESSWVDKDPSGGSPGVAGNVHVVYSNSSFVDCSTATGTLCTTSYATAAHSGNTFIDLTGGGYDRILTQDIVTEAGKTYDLSYYVLNSGALNGGGALSLLVGIEGSFASTTVGVSGSAWQQVTTSFVAVDALTTIAFRAGGKGTNYTLLGLDDVSVTAVPEPESYAMFALGLLAVGGVARRRTRKHA